MPIHNPAPYVLQFSSVSLDMQAMTATVVLVGTVGGQYVNQVSFVVPSADLAEILSAAPVPGLTRGDDFGGAIYQYAVAHGYAQGAIS